MDGGILISVELDPSWHYTAPAIACALLEQLPEMGWQESKGGAGTATPGRVAWRIERPDFVSDQAEWGEDTSDLIHEAPPCPEQIAEMDELELSLAMSWPKTPYRDEPPDWADWVKNLLWMNAEGFQMQQPRNRK